MRVTVNEDTGKLINGFSFPEEVPDQILTAKRGDSKSLDLRLGQAFATGGRQIATPRTIKFMAKVAGDNDGDAVVSNYDPDLGSYVSTETNASGDYSYRLNPGWNTVKLNNLLGHDPEGFAEVTKIRTIRDTAGSLHQKYFILYDAAGSVGVWLNSGGGSAPAQASACARVIEVPYTQDFPASDIATAIADELGPEWTVSVSGSLITITDAEVGARTAATAGDSGFIVTRWITGSLPNTMTNVESVDLDAEIEITEDGVVTSTQTFTFRVSNDIVKGNEGIPVDATPAYPDPAMLIQFHTALTGLTGGGATKLDGLTTANGQYNNRLVALTVSGALRIYQLQSGTTAESSPGIIRPDDYASSTNEKIWVQVL